MAPHNALIIGAGIAGPVAAMALQRAGINATIYEAYLHGAHGAGAWLSVAINGLDALRAIDLQDAVTTAGFPSPNITFVSGTGKHLGELPLGGTLADGTVTHTLKRADLYRVLYDEAVRRGIRVEHGRRLVDVSLIPSGGVIARFADGTDASGDLIVGADGLHSRVRRLIDPAAPAPRYTGLGGVGGFTSGDAVGLAPCSYQMIFGKRAFFAYTVSPSGEIWWFANPPSTRELSPEELAGTTTAEWKARLIALFRNDRNPAIDIIRAAHGELVAGNQYDLSRVPNWSRGQMLVIGDAAHAASPSSGQGASMAIEDAIELAICLRDVPDVGRAFTAYENRRRTRVERIVAHGASASHSKAAGPIARVLRDLMLPRMLARYAQAGTAGLDWMHNHHIEWNTLTDDES